MRMKLVLAEPNEGLRRELKNLLLFYNFFDIIAEFSGVDQANDFVCTNEVDVIFINADMGNARFSGDGSYLASNLSQNCPDLMIVMYSKEEKKASQMYKVHCHEFFQLPFDSWTMQRVVGHLKYCFDLLQYKRRSINHSLMVKTKQGYQLIAVDHILFVERVNRKNRMVMEDKKEVILMGYSMDELENMLEGSNFYRCYQSFLVNLSKVSFIRVNNETKNYALLLDGYAGEVMLSRNKYNEVVELLKNKYARISL